MPKHKYEPIPRGEYDNEELVLCGNYDHSKPGVILPKYVAACNVEFLESLAKPSQINRREYDDGDFEEVKNLIKKNTSKEGVKLCRG